jgi:hypothetical protein
VIRIQLKVDEDFGLLVKYRLSVPHYESDDVSEPYILTPTNEAATLFGYV